MSATIRKIAATGAGALLLLGTGAGVAVGETQEDKVQRALAVCGDGNLCVWDGPDFTGEYRQFHECLAPTEFGYPGQSPAGSWINTQYAPAETVFWGPDASTGELVPKYESPLNEAISDGEHLGLTAVDPC